MYILNIFSTITCNNIFEINKFVFYGSIVNSTGLHAQSSEFESEGRRKKIFFLMVSLKITHSNYFTEYIESAFNNEPNS